MGQDLSDVMKNKADEKEGKTREQLELLMKLADARLDTFEEEIRRQFLDEQSAMKLSIPGKRAMRFERSVRVDVAAETSPEVSGAVDAFFGAAQEGADVRGQALEGFKDVVKAGLKVILGDTSVGESYDKKFFVCVKHNAIIRVDMYSYCYNPKNEGLVASSKKVFAYILCISVVDHTKVTPDEMVYLISEFAGDKPEEYNAYLGSLIAVWEKLQKASLYPPQLKEGEYNYSREIYESMMTDEFQGMLESMVSEGSRAIEDEKAPRFFIQPSKIIGRRSRGVQAMRYTKKRKFFARKTKIVKFRCI